MWTNLSLHASHCNGATARCQTENATTNGNENYYNIADSQNNIYWHAITAKHGTFFEDKCNFFYRLFFMIIVILVGWLVAWCLCAGHVFTKGNLYALLRLCCVFTILATINLTSNSIYALKTSQPTLLYNFYQFYWLECFTLLLSPWSVTNNFHHLCIGKMQLL